MLECRNESVWYQREPTIAEILSDSIVKAMMRADGVDAEVLERDLRSVAQTIEANSRMPLRFVPAKVGTQGPSTQCLQSLGPRLHGDERRIWHDLIKQQSQLTRRPPVPRRAGRLLSFPRKPPGASFF